MLDYTYILTELTVSRPVPKMEASATDFKTQVSKYRTTEFGLDIVV